MKSFSKWSIEEVEETFHVVQHAHYALLDEWMTSRVSILPEEQQQFKYLQEKLLAHVWDWNEEELKGYFILPLLELVNFDQPGYTPFLSRELTAQYQDDTVSGTVDFMVAGGKRSPKSPYFFIHEYKKEHDSSDDPLGQLMIAMVAAQIVNNDGHPVYGAYVMGRYWHFVVLDQQNYAVHTGLNASDEELERIFSVLKQTKIFIDDWVKAQQEK